MGEENYDLSGHLSFDRARAHELMDDYSRKCELFLALNKRAQRYWEKDAITVSYLNEIGHTIGLGRRIMCVAGELDGMQAGDEWPTERTDLLVIIRGLRELYNRFVKNSDTTIIFDDASYSKIMKDEGADDSEPEDSSEFLSLLVDCNNAVEYFDQLYSWVEALGKRNRITTSEFGEIDEALDVGRDALRTSAELSAHSRGNYYAKPRNDLVKRVYEVLNIRRAFISDPEKDIVMEEGFQP